MAATAALAFKIPRSHSLTSFSVSRQSLENNNLSMMLNYTRIYVRQNHITTSSARISRSVKAFSKTQRAKEEKATNADDEKSTPVSQGDLDYLVRLGGGSIAGAALIKYGSVILPEITRPNLVQALLMISAPVLVSVFLLLKQSSED